MDYLSQQLKAAEAKYLSRFYDACKEMFSGCYLPSHDHTHHLRVWVYCKQLLRRAWQYGHSFSNNFVEALLAAALFHDVGLSRITDERHGPEGAKLFKQYMASNPDVQLGLLEGIADAIRVHDLKNPASLGTAFDLASMLTICDSLDSFGYIGVYRYSEIYLIRKMDVSDVAQRSLSNLEKHFKSFELHYAQLPELYEEQKQRYLQTCSVFKDEQAMTEIVEAVLTLSIKGQKSIAEIIEVYSKKSNLPFWELLRKELA